MCLITDLSLAERLKPWQWLSTVQHAAECRYITMLPRGCEGKPKLGMASLTFTRVPSMAWS